MFAAAVISTLGLKKNNCSWRSNTCRHILVNKRRNVHTMTRKYTILVLDEIKTNISVK